MKRGEERFNDKTARRKEPSSSTLSRAGLTIAAVLIFLVTVIASGCSGFFVDPTLTEIAVTPPDTIDYSRRNAADDRHRFLQ